ncbi:hypothetical protein C4D60_Mb10t12550 [Musa balbisiana]|uniref:Uncharacterized protein n=1 Tax=Musa balbisiana TaxID=52838 RepID=A0A4S8IXH1_MUSBA|nr:hypothetical protein C4D60_Mb10t12550 [Musa balbisiana]
MKSSSRHVFFVADDRTPNVLDLKSGVKSMSSWPLHEQLFIADNQMSNVVDLKCSGNAVYFFLHHALSEQQRSMSRLGESQVRDCVKWSSCSLVVQKVFIFINFKCPV